MTNNAHESNGGDSDLPKCTNPECIQEATVWWAREQADLLEKVNSACATHTDPLTPTHSPAIVVYEGPTESASVQVFLKTLEGVTMTLNDILFIMMLKNLWKRSRH